MEATTPLPPEIWAQTPVAAQSLILAQQAELVALRALLATVQEQFEQQLAALQARVQELEARLAQNSTNSSRPPSSDPPQAPARRGSGPTGRRPGGQPGHEAHRRPLLPVEEVDHVVDYWPSCCARCGQPLAADPALETTAPERHQVLELPHLRAEVTEHRVHHVRCPCCRAESSASLPPVVPPGAFGPRVQATVALLSGRYRLSRREVADLCRELLGAPLAVGSVDHLCQATGTALAEPVAQLERAVQAAAVANADETGWKRAGQRGWLWVVVTAMATVFTIARSRGSPVIKGLLGEDFSGALGSDRWSAYAWVPAERRQVCWAHLRRDFQALVDYGGAAVVIGKLGLVLTDRLFAAWHLARDDPAARPRFIQAIGPLQGEFRALLEIGSTNRVDKAAGLCRQLLKLWPALWSFASVPGVEPTNNVAERALRPAVLWRKGCFGSQSAEGERFVARMLSVAATCRQQGRSLLDYLTDACSAAQRGRPIPSLLQTSVPAHGV